MGTVYTPPEEFVLPDPTQDWEKYDKESKEYEERLIQTVKDLNLCPEAGEVIRFQVADGYARYVVYSLKPVVLIHINTYDAYQFQYAHRLTAKDIREQLRKEKALDDLFKKDREKK